MKIKAGVQPLVWSERGSTGLAPLFIAKINPCYNGATTFNIIMFTITAISITIKNATLSITALNTVMLSADILNVVMLSLVAPL